MISKAADTISVDLWWKNEGFLVFLKSFLGTNPGKIRWKTWKWSFLTNFYSKKASKCFKNCFSRVVFVRLGLKMMIFGSKITKNSDFGVLRPKITIFARPGSKAWKKGSKTWKPHFLYQNTYFKLWAEIFLRKNRIWIIHLNTLPPAWDHMLPWSFRGLFGLKTLKTTEF